MTGENDPPSRRGTTVASSVVDIIGETPVVALERLTRGLSGRIVAKLEFLNPGFSKKDRIAKEIIDAALASGELRPRQPVVESTSGNTGTGLAIVCAVRGHPFTAVMSEGNSRERARMMRALGATVVLVPQAKTSRPGQVSGEDWALVEQRARALTEEQGAFKVDQFARDLNRRTHELHTGVELWRQTEGQIHAFCDFVGTGGTYAGITAALKKRNPSVRCYVVEPEGAAVLAGEPARNANHRIQGGGYGISALDLLAGVPVDGHLQIADAEAIDVARQLARLEGIFGGFSSGAVVAAALQLLKNAHKGETIAVVLADSGLKYLSTDLWDDRDDLQE
ncbi:MAG: PLP-dependent cysteine synthase family protein [Aestuariivirgaceae bacterium]